MVIRVKEKGITTSEAYAMPNSVNLLARARAREKEGTPQSASLSDRDTVRVVTLTVGVRHLIAQPSWISIFSRRSTAVDISIDIVPCFVRLSVCRK